MNVWFHPAPQKRVQIYLNEYFNGIYLLPKKCLLFRKNEFFKHVLSLLQSQNGFQWIPPGFPQNKSGVERIHFYGWHVKEME